VTRTSPRSLATVRRAGFMSFLLLGHLVLCSVAWVPEYIDRLGVSFATWGIVLSFAPLGAISAIVVAPSLINRVGVMPVMRVSGILSAGFLIPLGFTDSLVAWTAINTVFNFTASLAGVAVNTHAVMLQKKVPESIMSGMHAGWSVGAVAAATTGGIASVFIPLEDYLILVGVMTAVGFVATSRFLLSPTEDGHREERMSGPRTPFYRFPARLWLLSFGLLCSVMPEIAMFEWSATLARAAGVDLVLRALPFATFMLGMIAGRLSISRLTRRFDVHSISVTGALVSGSAMAVGLLGAHLLGAYSADISIIWLAALWLFAGLGLAPLGPTMMSSSSTLPGITTTQAVGTLSFVTQSVSIGAKIAMGAVAEGYGVSWAFILPIILIFLGAAIAHRTSEKTRARDLEFVNPPTGPLPVFSVEEKD